MYEGVRMGKKKQFKELSCTFLSVCVFVEEKKVVILWKVAADAQKFQSLWTILTP